jgi:hypothetical protein
MGWSPVQRLVSATKPSHQEAIPANSGAHPALAGSFNPYDSGFWRDALDYILFEQPVESFRWCLPA